MTAEEKARDTKVCEFDTREKVVEIHQILNAHQVCGLKVLIPPYTPNVFVSVMFVDRGDLCAYNEDGQALLNLALPHAKDWAEKQIKVLAEKDYVLRLRSSTG